MEWQVIIALVIAIPVILFPVAFVWYLNATGMFATFKQAAARRALRNKDKKAATAAR